ncbi:hypothetical protein V1508DRAFT_459217 [Lipomyces doorenjongii]|uniref:uncharacterized protein n=1 Tax=Lipomyces doorenjongii TaxID=383834 RepID=UPI0034CF185C
MKLDLKPEFPYVSESDPMPVCSSSFDPFTSSPRFTAASDLKGTQSRINHDSDDILESDAQDTGTSAPDYAIAVTSSPMAVLLTDPIDVVYLQRPRTPEDCEEPVEVICEIMLSPINRNCIRRPPGTARSRKKNPLKDDVTGTKTYKRPKVCKLAKPHEAHQPAGDFITGRQKRAENSCHLAPDRFAAVQINENKLTVAALSSECDLRIVDFPSSPPPRTSHPGHTL